MVAILVAPPTEDADPCTPQVSTETPDRFAPRWRPMQKRRNYPSSHVGGSKHGGATEVEPVWRLFRELQLQHRVPMPCLAQRAPDSSAEPRRMRRCARLP